MYKIWPKSWTSKAFLYGSAAVSHVPWSLWAHFPKTRYLEATNRSNVWFFQGEKRGGRVEGSVCVSNSQVPCAYNEIQWPVSVQDHVKIWKGTVIAQEKETKEEGWLHWVTYWWIVLIFRLLVLFLTLCCLGFIWDRINFLPSIWYNTVFLI